MDFKIQQNYALNMDENDSLAHFRSLFHFPTKEDRQYLYFCGNSLGLQPKSTSKYVNIELEKWQRNAVEGHFTGERPWMDYHEFLTESLATLVGAKKIEVVAMNSLTTNLHLLMVSFYQPTENKNKILIEGGAFPSDRYAVESQIRFHGYNPDECLLEIFPREGEFAIRKEDIQQYIEQYGDSIALILLGGVNYYTGQVFPMKEIVEWGHKYHCRVGFDLAHAIGNIPLHLHDWNVDFAVWCGYKYLNGGPGGVGGGFVHEKHAYNEKIPKFTGWWGHNKQTRFQMPKEFSLTPGAEGWQLSNAPVLLMAALIPSLEIFMQANIENLRKKSIVLTSYLEYLIHQKVPQHVNIITPENNNDRGAQLSLILKKKGKEVYQQLFESLVISDWREPNSIRIAPVPLYNSFEDVWLFVDRLEKIVKND